ncbi:30S ribosomal protein S1 [Algiphilus sp.]|uniref:30S ribosomal protein S1 n=1 Tax=Algiphilus sp. TaxID=1872431 RepID=UPI001CA627BD|nr:30S ribosomal protein S1 [Algiphilus sp.]MBY8965098.1 30S ribosomal protein S1 [Algiphilus acroporae]MCI5062990.1 30S ribosomal protein S1 [Algiphilus sp.]MCI5104251.1 30S ribosomal protein S1 [Algiphilus sp.]MCR9091441.1 30S ribosomal protein S1 [Pseudomonadota bacterium]
MSESFAELFEQSLAQGQSMQPGALVRATVLEIKSDVVIVDAGLKSEGVIALDEFKNEMGELSINSGDEVEVALETVEDGFGETRFSKEKAERIKTWGRLQDAFDNGEIVNGTITGKVKGGFTVDIGAVRAFLPGSLVDVRPVRDTAYLEGKPLEFKVIKLDQQRNNIVVSRREVLEAEYSAEREQLLETLQEGVVLNGVVKNLVDYGAFVDLGGIDGLLHITDMSWKRIKDPSEVVSVGDEIEVKVLKYDRERRRVSLGLKQLGEDPWVDIARRYPEKTRLFGKVTNITDYGSFVEIESGVEGLVHVSEMDWTNKNVNPNKVVTIGDEVEVMILDIDEERRRISLGMKQCVPNPWEEFAQNFQKGDRVKGTIKSITDFGVFIGIDGGIDGLVHLSDLSWNETGEEAVRRYSKGQEVEATVLAIDAERERISLGIKQMTADPVAQFIAENKRGEQVTGTVREVEARGALIDLADGVEGYIKANDLARDRIDDATKVLAVGDELTATFVGIDRKSRVIQLSVRAKEIQEEEEAVAEYSNSRNATTGRTSLGDLLKEHIGD